jgi:hypothetical protein
MSVTVTLSDDALYGVDTPTDSVEIVRMASLPREVRLGRVRPAALPCCPRLSAFFDEARAAAPPASLDRRKKAGATLARMYLNDRFGCCVISGKAHALGLWSANDSDSGGEIAATDEEILAQYNRWKAGPGDSGCVITHVLDAMRSAGFRAGGKLYRIDGYVACDPRSELQTKVVQTLFGATTIGINLPQAWTTAAVWDVTSSRSAGGHDVTPIDYDEKGVYVSSWGRIYLITWRAWTSGRYVEEYYAMLAPSWYGPDRMAPSGVDAPALSHALSQLSRGQLPELAPEDQPPPAGLYRRADGPGGSITFTPA